MNIYISKSLHFEVPVFVQVPVRWIAALLIPFLIHYVFLYAFHNPYVSFALDLLFLWLIGPLFGYALAASTILVVPLGKYRRRGILFLCLLGLFLFSYINYYTTAPFYSFAMLFLSLGLGLFLKFASAFPDTNYTK